MGKIRVVLSLAVYAVVMGGPGFLVLEYFSALLAGVVVVCIGLGIAGGRWAASARAGGSSISSAPRASRRSKGARGGSGRGRDR